VRESLALHNGAMPWRKINFAGFSKAWAIHRDRRLTVEEEDTIMRQIGLKEWFQILRVHYQWPLFQAVRYALWLSR
jgi:hypothetical protein